MCKHWGKIKAKGNGILTVFTLLTIYVYIVASWRDNAIIRIVDLYKQCIYTYSTYNDLCV